MALIKNCHEDTGMEPTGSHFPKLPISKLGWQSLLFLCISIKTTLRPTITKCKCFQSQYKSVINLGVFLQTPGKQRWHLFFHQFGGQTRNPLFSREKEHEYSKPLRDIADIKVPMLPTSVTLTEVHRPSCLIFLRLSGMSNLQISYPIFGHNHGQIFFRKFFGEHLGTILMKSPSA